MGLDKTAYHGCGHCDLVHRRRCNRRAKRRDVRSSERGQVKPTRWHAFEDPLWEDTPCGGPSAFILIWKVVCRCKFSHFSSTFFLGGGGISMLIHAYTHVLQYELQMLPFKVAGYVPEDGEKAIFFNKIIRIASAPSLPMPSRSHSSSVASSSSRSSPLHRPSQVPLPPSRPATPAPPRSSSSTPRLDRPLPSIPVLPPYEQLENIRRPPDLKEHLGHLGDGDGNSVSESENTALRRAATAPRVPPRPPFPVRQCTR